jgi:hypothetical protein
MIRPFAIAALVATALAQSSGTCNGSTSISGPYPLVFRNESTFEYGPTIYPVFLPGVRERGIDNHQDSILVTHYKNGTALSSPPYWEHVYCSDLRNHPLPPGYYRDDEPTNFYFGILRPSGDTQRCLALQSSEGYNTKGDYSTLVLAENCSAVDAKYRTFMLEDRFHAADGIYRIFFADSDNTARIADTPYGKVYYVTNDRSGDPAAKSMLMIYDSSL